MSRIAAPLFVLIHGIGLAFAVGTAWVAWVQRPLLQLLIDRALLPLIGGAGAFVVPVLVGALLVLVTMTVIASAWTIVATLRRWRRGIAETHVGLRLRVLAYVVVGCVGAGVFVFSEPETFTGPFRVQFPILMEILGSAAYAAYLRWASRIAPDRQPVPGRLRRAFDVIAMNAVLGLVVLEIALRVISAVVPIPLLVTNESSSRIRRDAERLPAGQLKWGFPVNETGHYDTAFVPSSELSGRLVISIGDSFSYGTTPHAYHYSTVAERALKDVSVYNMGFPGTGPGDYRHLLEGEALPLDPDLIVVQLFMGNDITAGPPYRAEPGWADADSYKAGILWHRLGVLRRAAEDREAAAHERAPEDFSWVADVSLEVPSFGEDVYEDVSFRNAVQITSDHIGLYDRFEASLAALAEAAEGVPLAFVLIPDEFQVEDALWARVSARLEGPHDRDLPQKRTLAWLEAHDFPVLDLLPLLRAVEPLEDGDRHLYHLRDTHFNARGNAVAGQALARFVGPLLETGTPRVSRVSLPFSIDLSSEAASERLVRGWHPAEDGVSWSAGPSSELIAPLSPGADVAMDFDCLPFVGPDGKAQQIKVLLNGANVAEVVVAPGRNRYSVTLPRKHLRRWRNVVRFEYGDTYQPSEVLENSADERILAVAWYEISFRSPSNGLALPTP